MEQEAAAVDFHPPHSATHPPAHGRPVYGAVEFRAGGEGGRGGESEGDGVSGGRGRSFGFECEFEIAEGLQGRIKQDGISFELFVNGEGFEEMCKKDYKYGKGGVI